ncbi:MAG: phosphate ABC transporter substrate-binding protein PstS [Proteobacteria bacterium CG1_02_64_396]|nr:MAG: phosphate ABC transporter substrate-binding protein PstS [Proteobacteria bacterium CG1_02_64_396]
MRCAIRAWSLALGMLLLALPQPSRADNGILGAGSTFAFPVLAVWGYDLLNKGGFDYRAIGSGGGIKSIVANAVDFGASDAPMKPEELRERGLVQFPFIMGGVVPAANLPGIESNKLNLTGPLLAKIFMGQVRRWNNPEIRQLNPDLTLPPIDITVVHRADGSGTTWIFSDYLTKVSSDWANTLGTDKEIAWPVGIGADGNSGVAEKVRSTVGAIGYMEFGAAMAKKLTLLRMQNRQGNFIAPSMESFQAAAAHADWKHAPGFFMVLTDQPGAEVWPIAGVTYALLPAHSDHPTQTRRVLAFFDQCFEQGQKTAAILQYVPMPPSLVDTIRHRWDEQLSFRSIHLDPAALGTRVGQK